MREPAGAPARVWNMARLDEDKVRELWERYKYQGDKAARDRLILAYSPLVKYVAGRMGNGLPSHIEEADLISYGLLGLIGALERFDPMREIKFETYAISRIKGSIIDELRSLDWVPRSVRSKAREIEKVCAVLENRLQRAPRDAEIAGELGISVPEFQQSLTQIANTSIVALDELWAISGSDGDQASLIDTIEDPKSKDPSRMLDLSEMKARLAAAIDALPKREKIVIALYYYENLTLREIGEVLGVTESRVSQLHTKAILRLKGRLRDEIEPAAIG
jgi:RNA polymerase sigma factor for flagellar operon FliA